MLPRILAVEKPPMQTRMINAVAIPALENIHLAVRRPRERIRRQQPKRRPDARGPRRAEPHRQRPAVPLQRLVRCQSRARVPLAFGGCAAVGDGADHELPGRRVEAVLCRVDVVL